MSEIKNKIFKELNELEDLSTKLKSVANHSEKQTDLEVAILTEQVKILKQKNETAADFIDKSVKILEALQK